MKVGIIDYGVGNLGSIARALESLGVTPVLVDNAMNLHTQDRLILPGVGNFTDCMHLLDKGGWTSALREEVITHNRPLLGICLGMQLLADSSTEGANDAEHGTKGLGLVHGRVMHLSKLGCNFRIPHVGWNSVSSTSGDNHLFQRIPDGTDFYFVHSYVFVAQKNCDVLATTDYGTPVAAAVGNGLVWGTQFHPEKSSRAGIQLLSNFLTGPIC